MSQADIAVLVVASASAKFEADISKNGQTREHILSYMFGVKQLIGVVNKMDEKTVNYSEKGHIETETETWNFLKQTGFNTEKIPFVPISDFNGDNTVEHWKNSRGTGADAP